MATRHRDVVEADLAVGMPTEAGQLIVQGEGVAGLRAGAHDQRCHAGGQIANADHERALRGLFPRRGRRQCCWLARPLCLESCQSLARQAQALDPADAFLRFDALAVAGAGCLVSAQPGIAGVEFGSQQAEDLVLIGCAEQGAVDVQTGEVALSAEETSRELKKKIQKLPKNSDYKAVLKLFPEPRLAKKIFGTMENAHILPRSTPSLFLSDIEAIEAFPNAAPISLELYIDCNIS